MAKPVLIYPWRLEPITNPVFCSSCKGVDASWKVFAPGSAPDAKPELWCAKCWLYLSPWCEEYKDGIEVLIEGVQVDMNVFFLKDPATNRLVMQVDANRILGAIVAVDRMLATALGRGRL